jgi:Na+-driven multidrug efflux pump
MNRLLKNIAWDIFLTWPLIYFGLFMQNVYAYNMAIASFWFTSIVGIIIAISIIASDELLQKAVAKYKKPLWIHKKYGAITSFCEIAAMFAMGYFWLGGFYAAAVIFVMAMKEKVAEEAGK